MKLTVLGFYGGYPFDGEGTTSFLLQKDNYNLLIDAGSNSVNELSEIISPLDLDAVLLSHYHNDHIADLGVLQYYWQLNGGKKKEEILPIYGTTQDPLHFGSLTWPNSTVGKAYNDFETLNLGPFKINFLRTKHPVPTYAMRIDDGKSILTFTADTDYFKELTEFCEDSDLLITDTNFNSEKVGRKWHMTSIESGSLAKDSHSKKLLLSHLPQEISHEVILNEARQAMQSENVYLAKNKLVVEF